MGKGGRKADFRIMLKYFKIKKAFRYYIKQIDSMLLCVYSVIDHRRHQNVVRTSVTHAAMPRLPLFCSYHILTSSVIYYCTDARQHGIYLLIISHRYENVFVGIELVLKGDAMFQ